MNHVVAWDMEHAKRLMYGRPLRVVEEYFAEFDHPWDYKVLEVGCGAGSNAVWLAEQGFQVHAFDSSPNAITRLLDMDKERRIRSAAVGDATKGLPYPDAKFDIVFEVRALENLSKGEVQHVYKEIARVLVPGGQFFGVTASQARDLTKTTCGVVRRTSPKTMDELLAAARLEMLEMFHRCDVVHDLCVIATKG